MIVPLLVEEKDIPRIKKMLLRGDRPVTGEGVVDTDRSLSIPSREVQVAGSPPSGFEGILGVITSPPTGEDSYTDNRYWVEIVAPMAEAQPGKRRHVTSNKVADSVATPVAPDDQSTGVFARVTATNLFQDRNHMLGLGDMVNLWQVSTGGNISGEEAAGTTRDPNTSTETTIVHWYFFRPIPGLTFVVNCEFISGSFGTDLVDAAMLYDVTGEKTPVQTLGLSIAPILVRYKKTTYETITTSKGLGYFPEVGTFTLLQVYEEIPKTAVCP